MLHALGEKKYPSVHAILAFKGKCAVEKEGMIGEIKLKCRKKNISNRRELLPVVLAKMLSCCSVRIHRCAGSPADNPNTMPICQVPGKLSCNCSLRDLSSSASSDLGGSAVPYFPGLAGQPLGHSCSICWLSCQRRLQRQRRAGLWSGLHRHCVTNSMGGCLLWQSKSNPHHCPNTDSLHSNNLQSFTTVHCSSISRCFTSSLYSSMKTSLSPQVTCLKYLHCSYIGREQPVFEHPRLHCWCFSSYKKPENLLKTSITQILHKNYFPSFSTPSHKFSGVARFLIQTPALRIKLGKFHITHFMQHSAAWH